MQVALIQYDIIWESPKENLDKLNKLLSTLHPDTEIAFLPEMFNTGFTMNTAMASYADTTLNWMKSIAQRLQILIAGSMMVEEEGKYYNRFYWVEPGGKLSYYDKRHLFGMGRENQVMTSGTKRIITSWKGINFMLQICYDLRFPTFARNRYHEGKYDYDVLVYVANWPEVRRRAYEVLLPARAVENQAFVLWINRSGKDDKGISHTGDSCIIDPNGEILTRATSGAEEIIYATIDKKLINSIRRDFPVAGDWD